MAVSNGTLKQSRRVFIFFYSLQTEVASTIMNLLLLLLFIFYYLFLLLSFIIVYFVFLFLFCYFAFIKWHQATSDEEVALIIGRTNTWKKSTSLYYFLDQQQSNKSFPTVKKPRKKAISFCSIDEIVSTDGGSLKYSISLDVVTSFHSIGIN